MKTKKQSLPQAHQPNNLKDMLEFYNDKSKILQQDPDSFQPLCEYDEAPTQSIMLPRPSFESFAFPFKSNNSEIVHRNKHFSLKENQQEHTTKSRQIFSRENLSEINKKLRNIRTNHYQRQHHIPEIQYDYQPEEKPLLVAKEALIGIKNINIQKSMTHSSQFQRSSQQYTHLNTPEMIKKSATFQ